MRRAEPPVREPKVRSACDRCHDLKNRCIRTGGPDSRCDRCERLDIDCVYRTADRMGRPRIQRQGRLQDARRAVPETRHTPNPVTMATPPATIYCSSLAEFDSGIDNAATHHAQGLPQGSVASNSPANPPGLEAEEALFDFQASPGGQQESFDTHMDWGLDYSHQLAYVQHPEPHPFPVTMVQPPLPPAGPISGMAPLPQAPKPDFQAPLQPVPRPHQDSGPDLHFTDKLLHLQMQLHRILSTGNHGSAMDDIEEGLEVTKTFLEILQGGLGPLRRGDDGSVPTAPAPSLPPARQDGGPPGVFSHTPIASDSMGGNAEPPTKPVTNPQLSYMAVQQALLCYSYVLHVLDRAVSSLSTNLSDSTALSLGFFNLASQSTLNAEVLLHLVLRMAHHLRAQIHLLVSGCRDLADLPCISSRSPSSSAISTGEPDTAGDLRARGARSSSRSSSATSATGTSNGSNSSRIAATFHLVADVVREREELLVGRLTRLTGGSGG